MKTTGEDSDAFYIGYLPAAPSSTARFVRRVVGAVAVVMLTVAALSAFALPYFGTGEFEFGRPHQFEGRSSGGVSPRLTTDTNDYLLVGEGKHGVPPELCGGGEKRGRIEGTLIRREGRELIEVSKATAGENVTNSPPPVPLGRFTLRGEIVDAKCYFGVMNPAEGRVHRACAELCLRGGIPAVFVARDRSGGVVHVILSGSDTTVNNVALLPWVGAPVELSGEVSRVGRWLTMSPDLGTLHLARR